MYKVATFFNRADWEEHGKSWVEKAKSQGLCGYILFDKKVNPIAIDGFECISCELNSIEVFSEMCSKLDNYCLFTKPSSYPIGNIIPKTDILCASRHIEDFFLFTRPIVNLSDRAKVISSLKNKKVFSCDFLLGSQNFWKNFIGFQRCLIRNNFVEKSFYKDYIDIVLNVFVSLSNFSVETIS